MGGQAGLLAVAVWGVCTPSGGEGMCVLLLAPGHWHGGWAAVFFPGLWYGSGFLSQAHGFRSPRALGRASQTDGA